MKTLNKFAQFPTYEDTTQNIDVENQRFTCLRLVCSTEGREFLKRLPPPRTSSMPILQTLSSFISIVNKNIFIF